MYFNNSLCGFWFGLTWFSFFLFFLDDTIICLMVVEWLFQKYLFPPGQQSSWQRGDSRGSWSISHHIWSLLVWPKILICIVKVSTTLVCLSVYLYFRFLLHAFSPAPFIAESLALWGFRGSSSPPFWVSLLAGQGDDVLGLQERYLPLGLEMYGCPRPATQKRKDLELLRKATGQQ